MTHVGSPSKTPTGIEGLDDILRGGLPRGSIYLVKGTPGVGKTTLALQFILAGRREGETSLYITLSETEDELRNVASSHGWSLDGVTVFAAGASIHSDSDYSMYHPSEVELKEVMALLLAEVDRVNPSRVVFDSLSEIRLLAQDPLRYRRQILALKRHFVDQKRTVLLLDDHGADADNHLESLAHGVIALERHPPVYGGVRRRLEVVKLRGVKFRDGFHDYAIEPGGLEVYPRLIASEHEAGVVRSRLTSGVAELDQLLGGGLDSGTATLVIGPAGSGKSALAAHYAVASARAGKRAIVFSFDESVSTAMARGEALGLPMSELIENETLRIVQVDPSEISPGQFAFRVKLAVEHDRAAVVVIDSLTGYLNSMPEEQFLLNQLHELLAYLAQQGTTTILIATQHGLMGPMVTPVDVSYLADSVILLRYFEALGSVRSAISVMKRRIGPHEKALREYKLGPHGIEIGAPLKEFQGVLMGTPRYLGTPEPLLEDARGTAG